MDNSEKYFSIGKKEKYQFDVWDYKQLSSQHFENIIKSLRGKYIGKTDNFIVRMISLPFMILGISEIITMLSTDAAFDLWEFIICIIFIAAGIFLYWTTIGFLYFDDTFIYDIGPFKKIIRSIDKSFIEKIELIAVKDNFFTDYSIYITYENKEFIIPIGCRMKAHIEGLSGKPVKDIISRIEYRSMPINSKNIIYILISFIIIFAVVICISIILIILVDIFYI
ncbi:MAG: hypothetical protein GY749_16955 [Desulfobacteraceae bacterium]|nr:hypothetical protein [Desulfobacteraceae bacterium]